MLKAEKPTTKSNQTTRLSIQIPWRNQKLYRQAEAERIQHHQSSFTTKLKNFYGWETQEMRQKEEGGKKTYKNKPQTIKKMATGIHTLIVILNVNRINAPTKS